MGVSIVGLEVLGVLKLVIIFRRLEGYSREVESEFRMCCWRLEFYDIFY